MSQANPADQLRLNDIRDEDGYYRDGLEALNRALVWVRASDDRDECDIPLPEGSGVVTVTLNGGVPAYWTDAPDGKLSSFHETTASGVVAVLEGHFRQVDGVPVDPVLPDDFDVTPNDERPLSHQIWWHRPFIVTDRWEPETWEQYRDRLASLGYEPDKNREQWDKRQADSRAGWFQEFPEGVRYDVRCLDGGAWDRPTWWGSFGTLDEAIECAHTGPLLRTRGMA